MTETSSPIRNEMIDLLSTRRSVTVKDLCEPGPTPEQRQQILEIAHRVPDHRKLGPWRFIIFEGEARSNFGNNLLTIYKNKNPDAAGKMLEFQRNTFNRAPLVIAIISSPHPDHKTPVWEQDLSVGAVCQNMLLAANAFGFGAQWLTEWYSYDADVNKELKLEDHEKIAGFIYIGTTETKPKERERPSLEERIEVYSK